MLSDNKRIAKNSVWMSIRMVIVLCITLYTTRIILKVLGVEDFGIYNVVCGFVSMFAFLNTSMSKGIQRFFNYEYGKNGIDGAQKVYETSVLIQIVLAAIVLILTESFGLWYLHHKMVIPPDRIVAAEWIFQCAIISFLFVITQAPYSACIMAHERMGYFAFVSILDAVLKLTIAFILPNIGYDQLIIYGILLVLISFINFTLYYCYCKRKFPEIKIHRTFHRHLFRSMLSFSGWNLFGSFSGVMKEQGINLIINLFFGPVINAARAIAGQINSGLQSLVQNITIPVRPQVVQSYAKGNIDRTMRLTYSISKLSCGLLTMVAVPVCYEMDIILKIWLGENIPSYTAIFTIIVIGCSYQSNLNAAISNVVHATGNMRNYQIWGSLTKCLSVPIAYFLLRIWDRPEIALLTVLICDILGHTVCLLIVRSIITFSIQDYLLKVIWPLFKVLVLSIAIIYPLYRFIDNNKIQFITVSVVSPITVGILLHFFALDKKEKNLFRQLLHSLYNKLIRKT